MNAEQDSRVELIIIDGQNISATTEPVTGPDAYVVVPYFIVLSFLGVYLRILTTIEGTLFPGILYPQILGCFIFGFTTEAICLVRLLNIKIALSGGLCGCITSYSAIILKDYLLFRDSVWNGVIFLFVSISASFGSYRLGQHVGSSLPIAMNLDGVEKLETRKIGMMVAAVTCIGVFVSVLVSSNRDLSISIALGPIGSLFRYYLAQANSRFQIPLGTFLANTLGCIILFIVFLLKSSGPNSTWCAILWAVENGICGGLTTISTFVFELDNLKIGYKYSYGILSLITSLLLALLILGSWTLSGGRLAPCEIENNISLMF